MRVVFLLKVKGGTARDRIARRAQWQYPEGLNVVSEHWLWSNDPALPHVILICEPDDNMGGPVLAAFAEWDDVFDITILPAFTAEEGLKLGQQMMQEEAQG